MEKPFLALVLMLVAGCAAQPRRVVQHEIVLAEASEERIANLERAARYPWKDDGVCAVREASGTWRTLVERCYHALDLSRIRFQDMDHRCAVANVDAATVGQMVGICLLVQPELVVGAVIVIGVVIVAAAIAAELNKLPCNCFCMAVDNLGKQHGPYKPGRVANVLKCRQLCLENNWTGAAFCGK